MKDHSLWKMEGAGNDFLLGTGRWAERLAHDPRFVVDLCRRRCGLGADGVLALFSDGGGRVKLVYRNADGSAAVFCANGTRCAALAAVRLLGLAPDLIVVTDWVEVPARVVEDGRRVVLDLPIPEVRRPSLNLAVAGELYSGVLLDVGVPHLIFRVDDFSTIDLEAAAPLLRRHPDLGPEGANVTFIRREEDGEIAIRTWERGVEGEILCCGSAVVAAGWLEIENSSRDAATFRARSGDLLMVSTSVAGVNLEGPARFIAQVEPVLFIDEPPLREN